MIQVTDLDHNGRGIARLDNKIVFIKDALPGEVVDIKIIKNKKNYIEASVNKYIKMSELRIKSKCPYYNDCGGCNLLQLDYENQLKFKKDKIKNILDKYLDKNIKINEIVKSDNEFNYRNKVTFHIKNKKLGFYHDNTNDIVEIKNCLLAHPLINNSIKYLNMLDLNNVDKIICRANNNKLMIIIHSKIKDINIDCLKEVAHSLYTVVNGVYNFAYGEKNLIEYVDNYKFIISPDSFFQINLNVCAKLYNKIKDYVDKNENILDLYCGTGTIGIIVSDDNNVFGIEVNKSAIDDANINKEINNIKNIKFLCGKSEECIKKINFKPDIIIVDPPRAGLDKKAITDIKNLKPKKIIYVSCDAMTLVRDLNLLKEDYNIVEITPFDMFPNTSHLENLCLLTLK